VDPERFKLIVNDAEAARVRSIFELYVEHQSLLPVVQELERRGWRNKRWTTRKGVDRGDKVFTRTNLYKLLTNIAYIGKIRYKDEVHDGEHQAIVDIGVWQRVQALLERNGRTAGAMVRNKFGALLKGMLRCVPCGCAMTPSHSTRGNKRYRYYVCSNAQKRGWQTCPSKSIPAGEIEQFVVERIKCIGKDPTLVSETFAAVNAECAAQIASLKMELKGLNGDIVRWNNEARALARKKPGSDPQYVAKLSDYQERIGHAERRATEIHQQIDILEQGTLDEYEVETALATFDPLWESLTLRERGRIIQLLVERVDYDGSAGKLSITFHPTGIKALAVELTQPRKEKSA
ncbi:MAG TPA: recombinase family protein, partial [Gemmataceae bacterium]|nr:recombinase family protein [Gemmataceae bacterium]